MERITSVQNARIKNILKLDKPRERQAQNLFVAEGFREISKALQAGFVIRELYFTREVNFRNECEKLIDALPPSTKVFEVTAEVFEKIAYRESSDGLIALCEPRYLKIADLQLPANPLILVVESVEKPGNLGAILRTADAAALDAVVVCDQQTDLYNPNVIRSSLGCIFSQQVAVTTSAEAIQFFKQKNIRTYAAALTAQSFYHENDYSQPSAIVMGSEANGLSNIWLNEASLQIKIPMEGMADSLNVSTSAAILVFEAKRQRWIKH
jgi:RNA methyltransferase, TrmH family